MQTACTKVKTLRSRTVAELHFQRLSQKHGCSLHFTGVVKVALKTVGHLDLGFQGHLPHQDSKVIL